MQEEHIPNRLIKAKSPYLRQHAYNPVDWCPWGEEALELAKKEDKPIIVSIGYAACHWCHVMERESFEDDTLSAIMNKHFICIKVDREERPDIDQIYMEAVQLMGTNGGWPLNVFLTPDTRPFYGGTYFPPQQWEDILNQIAKVFVERREEVEKSAEELTNGLKRSEVQRFSLQIPEEPTSFSMEEFKGLFQKLIPKFDREWGGIGRAPKFPMPSLYLFLLRYFQLTKDTIALEHTCLSLNYMHQGGIYDQIGGGFSRYSVDAEWFAPHFEKMLYDNAQLLAVYSEAYAITGSVAYKEAVYQTIAFVKREMRAADGSFYAALDADSEGVEGKFYVWTTPELEQLLGEDFPLFAAYYQVQPHGNWEHGNNILHRSMTDQTFAKQYQLSLDTLQMMLEKWSHILMTARDKRIRPGLDDKALTSWNALMIHGLCTAYQAFGEDEFLELALSCAEFIEGTMRNGEKLWHSAQEGVAHLQGYLEDYASLIQAYTLLYQCSFQERFLMQAKADTEYVIKHFYDKEEGFFFFTDDEGESLIARKKELFDSVIPSSNAIMAHSLHWLGILLDWKDASDLSKQLLQQAQRLLTIEPHYLSYWACLYAYQLTPSTEVCLVGPDSQAFAKQFTKNRYMPNKVMVGTSSESKLPLLQGRTAIDGKTTIYVCQERSCRLPVQSVEEAWSLAENS